MEKIYYGILWFVVSFEPVPDLCGALAAVLLVVGDHRLHPGGPLGQVLVGRQVDKVTRLQGRHCRHKVDVGNGHGAAQHKTAACHLVGPHERLFQRLYLLRRHGGRLAEPDRDDGVGEAAVEGAHVEVEPLVHQRPLLWAGRVEGTGLVLGDQVGEGGPALGDHVVPVHQDRYRVLRVEAEELRGPGGAAHQVHRDVGVVEVEQVQRHVDGPGGRRQGYCVQLEFRHYCANFKITLLNIKKHDKLAFGC